MPGLLETMFVATGAMAADQGALEATTNNAANVNFPDILAKYPSSRNYRRLYLNSEKVDLLTAANSISATDMAATATEFTQSQVALNAELAAMSRLSQTSLFDYLK